MNVEKVKKTIRRKNFMTLILAIFFIVLILPTITRWYSGNSALIGAESYHHKKAARELIERESWNPFSAPEGVEEKVYIHREYQFNPYHYFVAYLSRITSLEAASRIAPLLLGLLSLLAFNQILKKLIEERYKRLITLLLLVASPVFIYTFTVSNPNSAAILFTLLGFHFFIRKGKHNFILTLACLAIISLFGIFNTVLALLAMLAYVLTKKEGQNRFIIMLFIVAVITFSGRTVLYQNHTYAPEINVIGTLISDLGGLAGFGIFTIILAIYGVYEYWEKKKQFIYHFLLGLLLLMSIFYVGNTANRYLAFLVVIAAGYGAARLLDVKWDARIIKSITLLIILCGIIFSTVSYMTRMDSMEPTQEMIDALYWMKDNTFKDGYVLTHHKNGYLVPAIAENPVLADPYISSEHSQKFIYKVEDTMFYSRDLEEEKKLFDTYNIKYVLIDKKMKQGQVWTRENEGLLFLFTSKKTFENIYDKKGVEIWEVKNTTMAT